MFDLSNLIISSAMAADAVSTPAGPLTGVPDSGSVLMRFLPFFLILGVFYFLLIRPQQKKMQMQDDMVKALKKGDRVVTAGGFVGTITKLEGDTYVMMEIAKGIEIKVVKSTIQGPLDDRVPANQK